MQRDPNKDKCDKSCILGTEQNAKLTCAINKDKRKTLHLQQNLNKKYKKRKNTHLEKPNLEKFPKHG